MWIVVTDLTEHDTKRSEACKYALTSTFQHVSDFAPISPTLLADVTQVQICGLKNGLPLYSVPLCSSALLLEMSSLSPLN